MNEQLQSALTDLITKTTSGIDTASDFLAAEIPDVIQQLLLWHGVYNFVLFVTAIAIIPCFYWQAIWAFNKIPEHPTADSPEGNWYWDRYWGGSSVTGAGGSFFSIGAAALFVSEIIYFFTSINIEWLQIWIAPKVWLIEYASKLAS